MRFLIQNLELYSSVSISDYFELELKPFVLFSECKSKTSGICQLREDDASFHKNAGNYNKKLTFQDGVLALIYDGGEYCKHSKTNRTTIISFVCNGKAGSVFDRGTPVFVTESNDCTYYIDWHSSLACEKQVSRKHTSKFQ